MNPWDFIDMQLVDESNRGGDPFIIHQVYCVLTGAGVIRVKWLGA